MSLSSLTHIQLSMYSKHTHINFVQIIVSPRDFRKGQKSVVCLLLHSTYLTLLIQA